MGLEQAVGAYMKRPTGRFDSEWMLASNLKIL